MAWIWHGLALFTNWRGLYFQLIYGERYFLLDPFGQYKLC